MRNGAWTTVIVAKYEAIFPARIENGLITSAASFVSFKSQAAPDAELAPRIGFKVVDGIVPDPKATVQAGPNAIILPPMVSQAH